MIRVFRHYIRRSLLLLGLLEALIFVFSIYFAVALRFLDPEIGLHYITAPKLLVFTSVMILTMMFMGLYQRDLRGGIRNTLLRIIISFAVGLTIMSLLFYSLPDLFLGRGIMAFAAFSAFIGVLTGRLIFLNFADKVFLRRRVLVLGAGHCAARLEEIRGRFQRDGIEIVGYLPLSQQCVEIDSERLIGHGKSVALVVDELDIEEIVVAVDDRRNAFPSEELIACKMSGIEVVDLVSFLEKQTGKIDVKALHPSSLIFADGYVQTVVKPLSKRLFDMLMSLMILLVSWPIMLLTALAIRIESGFKGSVLYTQVRIGAGGRPFRIMKFRSMVENAEANGVQWAEENDARITKIGYFIRKTRIDELPQLFNVLKGNMSFVGPRPERPEFIKELAQKIPYYNLRHGLKPGITGWAQVRYQYGASTEDALQKLQYDLYYMKNYSVFLDIVIIFETIQVVLFQKGSR